MTKKQYTFKEIIPEDAFECFRMSLMINSGKAEASDVEVERYIYALMDTSDTHPHDRQPMNSKPTFKPVD